MKLRDKIDNIPAVASAATTTAAATAAAAFHAPTIDARNTTFTPF